MFMTSVLCFSWCCSFFFFQAEDGIRDLVRSRGLGDVYKRQSFILAVVLLNLILPFFNEFTNKQLSFDVSTDYRIWPVSYTHLTLPTSDLV